MKKPTLAYFGVKYFPSNGGVSRTTEYLIRKLKDKYDITIYCYKDPRAKNLVEGVTTIELPEIKLGGLGVFIHFVMCFIHMMFFRTYDVIHVRKIDSAFFLPLFALKYKRILATSHESPYVRDKWNRLAKAYFLFNERRFVKAKAKLTCISKPLTEYYKEKYYADVLYVPNGVEGFDDYHFEEAERLLQTHQVGENFVFFGARRIMATKGCHTLLKALKAMQYQGEVLIAGELHHAPDYIAELRELARGLNVKFLGYVGNTRVLLALVKKADFFIFPSETEGMSIMLLEATSTGTPAICSNIPENIAIFTNEEVLYFENKNWQDLADKFTWALEHPQEMQQRSTRANNKSRGVYSGDQMVKNYEALYDELLAQS